jgi:hypothetical protein
MSDRNANKLLAFGSPLNDRGEDDHEKAEEEESSTKRKVRFQQWVKVD